jgi:hypothetical protein
MTMIRRLEDILADIGLEMKGVAQSQRQLYDYHRETERAIAAARGETDAKLAEIRRETDIRIAEARREADALRAKTDKILAGLTVDVGGLGHSLGGLIEFLVVPGVRKEMGEAGHKFTRSYANKKFKGFVRGFKQLLAEVDLFLSNGDEAMAVEVKTSLSVEDVNAHLDQLKKLREHEEETNLRGKKLYGAVVGVFIDFHARKLALKNGLYVIEVLEYEKRLKTEKPPRCHVW